MADEGRTDWDERSRLWAEAEAESGGRAPLDDAVNRAIIEAAGIEPGQSVLDIASGTGDPALALALAMAGKGRVTFCDLVPRMLQTARSRAEALGIATLDFTAADMAALPFPDNIFDSVTCRFGLMSAEDKAAATSEARRVLRPGGRAVYVVSGAYEDNPMFWVPRRAIAAFFGEEEGPAPTRHSMSAPGILKDTLESGGFQSVEERLLSFRETIADPNADIERHLIRNPDERVRTLPADQRTALMRAIRAAWEPFTNNGALIVPHTARLAAGLKGAN